LAFTALRDKHVEGDSFLHRLDPRAKLMMTLSIIVCALLTPAGRWETFAALGCLILLGIALSGLGPRLVFGRSLLALPFTLAALPVLFRYSGDSLLEVPLFGWDVTSAGLEHLASILLRSWLSVLAATILTATTESDRLLRGLRSFGLPRLFVATISFMWRYIFVITEEAGRLLTAREARSARPPGQFGGSLAWRARVAGNLVGSLFLRSLNRSERVYDAMLARGYNGELLSLERFTLTQRDYAAALVTLAAVIAIQAYARF
jgi:cobalt/nickel transport system permease protein